MPSLPLEKFDRLNPRPLPETYPIPEVSRVDEAFPTAKGFVHDGGHYLDYYGGQCDLVPREWQKRADILFFKGGSLEKLGLRPKPGNDPKKIASALRFLLGSWEPKSEQKSATVGFALMMWCDEIDAKEKP